AKCLKYIETLEDKGLSLPKNYVEHMEGDLWELKPESNGNEYRFLFYAPPRDSPQPRKFVIVHALKKKTPKLKRGEIDKALGRIEELKSRERR
ncbi:MAG: type II toxin-antitoxin system RelE/ParE family toxin, partial [Blastocatellia bacterium]